MGGKRGLPQALAVRAVRGWGALGDPLSLTFTDRNDFTVTLVSRAFFHLESDGTLNISPVLLTGHSHL